MTWSFVPDAAAQRASIEIVRQEWKRAERPGRPTFAAAMYFALGPGAETRLRDYLSAYYDYSERARPMIARVPTHEEEVVAQAIRSYAEAGVDELLFSAPDASIEQVERLSELVARMGFGS
jgi:hypothetical protein